MFIKKEDGMKIQAEYIWIDGQKPTAKLRSKTLITSISGSRVEKLDEIPHWGFDGSSTEQTEGRSNDCMLKPAYFVPDPIRESPNVLVLCEVMNPNGSSHPSNTRVILREAAEKHKDHESWFGIEQEYTLYTSGTPEGWPLGWPEKGFPHPQGRYYCGVGYDEVHGRALVEAHARACIKAGLSLSGVNAEVMPSQWEFQIGPLDPLEIGDQLWLARWLLYRVGEDFGAYAKLDPKPMQDDWNGAGGHTNFSTKAMRESIQEVYQACKKLGRFHKEHIAVYGADNDKRLTGKHETCSIQEFRYGISDRGASIRIPMSTINAGRGYLEDRRPAANIDPYKVCTALIETVCGDGFDPQKYNW